MTGAVFALGLGAVALVVALARGQPPEPEPYIPTVDDIAQSNSFGALRSYYNKIGELYLEGEIDQSTYNMLYEAYNSRYYELLEA